MSTRKCANSSCSACHDSNEGKLFRLDLDIANAAGLVRQEVVFIWLCSRCARRMNPSIEITGNTVRVLLATVHNPRLTGHSSPATVN
jgi:hypothetical protein